MQVKYCQECEQVLKGRTDKRFCNDSCRNAFNNRVNSKENNLMKKINNQLKRNRKILQMILGEEKMYKSNKAKLLAEGYALDYHTHRICTSKGNEYVFCYEFGYLDLGNDFILIVKSKQKGNKVAK
jgi:hypothetical protein